MCSSFCISVTRSTLSMISIIPNCTCCNIYIITLARTIILAYAMTTDDWANWLEDRAVV